VSKLGFGVWKDSSPAAIEEVGWAAGDRRWVSGEVGRRGGGRCQRGQSRGGCRAVGGGGRRRLTAGGRTLARGGLHEEEDDAMGRGCAEEETRSRARALGCPIPEAVDNLVDLCSI
jgi:hypothetical protein